VNFKQIDNPAFEKINLNVPNNKEISTSKNISIYDCLSCFGQEETLSGNDKWYCSKCKDHVPAFKKMEIYKTPEFLIVHFKRFSHTRNSMFGSRKLNTYIEFPVQSLDL
jgi:ubiquitin C-terminal hydrolase